MPALQCSGAGRSSVTQIIVSRLSRGDSDIAIASLPELNSSWARQFTNLRNNSMDTEAVFRTGASNRQLLSESHAEYFPSQPDADIIFGSPTQALPLATTQVYGFRICVEVKALRLGDNRA